MWRRLSVVHLRTVKSLRSTPTSNLFAVAATSTTSPSPSSAPLTRKFSTESENVVKKNVEDVMPIATGHEREELEAQLQGKELLEINHPVGPFGTKEEPAVVKSYYDKRIVGCPGGEGEDEHDVIWFWLEKGKPHECPVCSQYFVSNTEGCISSLKADMSYINGHMGSGSRTARRTFEFGRTYVVRPKGKHQATIVWLHGLGDNGSSCSRLLESLPLANIKWICPTAPTRPVAILGGFPCTAWFDVGELSDDGPGDFEGLDASVAHVANLLSTEPAVKLGIGGFSIGAATALYSATCFAQGICRNGNLYPINLRAIVGLSGWLPSSRNLKSKIEGSQEAARRAASLPILLCHGMCDEVVPYRYGERSAHALSTAGFRNLAIKTYDGLGHYTVPQEMDEVCHWLSARLGLEGS